MLITLSGLSTLLSFIMFVGMILLVGTNNIYIAQMTATFPSNQEIYYGIFFVSVLFITLFAVSVCIFFLSFSQNFKKNMKIFLTFICGTIITLYGIVLYLFFI